VESVGKIRTFGFIGFFGKVDLIDTASRAAVLENQAGSADCDLLDDYRSTAVQ
jgi:hypothetical protein